MYESVIDYSLLLSKMILHLSVRLCKSSSEVSCCKKLRLWLFFHNPYEEYSHPSSPRHWPSLWPFLPHLGTIQHPFILSSLVVLYTFAQGISSHTNIPVFIKLTKIQITEPIGITWWSIYKLCLILPNTSNLL